MYRSTNRHRLAPSAGSKSACAALACSAVLMVSAAPVRAQCAAQWYPTAGVAGSAGYDVGALTAWDPDGAGPLAPVLAIGGSFSSAGGVPANNVATWDGSNYAPLGSGIAGEVDALAALPDGRLAAAGLITDAGGHPVTNVAVWNGSTWGTLGSGLNGQVWAMAIGTGGDLYAGGMFNTSGTTSVNHIARWNGTSWVPLGSGTANGVGGIVYGITALPNGDMVVGGAFTAAGGVANRRYIARWGNDGVWYPMGGGMNAAVLSVGTMSDGSVVAGGIFTFPGSRIAQWNGTSWLPMGAGTSAQPLAFLPLSGGHLIAAGHFVWAGTVAASKIAYWDGAAWSAMGIGMDQYIIALARMPSGDVFAGGGFTTVDGQPSPCLARWSSPTPAITTHPASQGACATAGVQFTIAATASPDFAWQVESPANSGIYTDLSVLPGPTFVEPTTGMSFEFAGAATDRLAITSIGLGFHPSVIRFNAVASNACGSITSNAAELSVCYANCDCSSTSPTLNVLDFSCFLNRFAAGEPNADCDQSGSLNVNDFVCFQSRFAAGCL